VPKTQETKPREDYRALMARFYDTFSRYSTRWVITRRALEEIGLHSTDPLAVKLALKALWMADNCKEPKLRGIVESMIINYEPGDGQAPW
jgi:hypothetical protein